MRLNKTCLEIIIAYQLAQPNLSFMTVNKMLYHLEVSSTVGTNHNVLTWKRNSKHSTI